MAIPAPRPDRAGRSPNSEPAPAPRPPPGDTLVLDYVGRPLRGRHRVRQQLGRGDPFTVMLGAGPGHPGLGPGPGRHPGRRPVPARHPGRPGLRRPGRRRRSSSPATPSPSWSTCSPCSRRARPTISPISTPRPRTGPPRSTTDDLVDGDGRRRSRSATSVYIELLAFRGDTGEQIDSELGRPAVRGCWSSPTARPSPDSSSGIPGMKVGGRRQITIPRGRRVRRRRAATTARSRPAPTSSSSSTPCTPLTRPARSRAGRQRGR